MGSYMIQLDDVVDVVEVDASTDGLSMLRACILSRFAVPHAEQRLIVRGHGLPGDRLVTDTQFRNLPADGSVVIVVERRGATVSASTPAAAPAAAPSTASAPSNVPATIAPTTTAPTTAAAATSPSPPQPQQLQQHLALFQHLVAALGMPPISAAALAEAASRGAAASTPSPALPPAAAAAPTTAAPAPAPPAQQRNTIALDRMCTRCLFGNDVLVQPHVLLEGKPICIACASHCIASRPGITAASAPSPVTPEIALAAPITCQCAFMRGHSCTFAARAYTGAEVLPEPVRTSALAEISRIAAQPLVVMQALEPRARAMQQRVFGHAQSVLPFERADWQAAALQAMPVAQLEERARAAIARAERALTEVTTSSSSSSTTSTSSTTSAPAPLPVVHSFRDELLHQLLHWFKHEFFTWTNQPPCAGCGGSTRAIGGVQPTPDELRFGARMVELYQCSNTDDAINGGRACGRSTRFPRYNDASKLLETRTGRCGEWAQVFMLCCRALRYDARMVYDWTDHVWVEVYSDALRRWLHCDSCENACDSPLMYESGWGKKLSYVLAFSIDECVDVTRRYTRKWGELVQRREECSEETLLTIIEQVNNALRLKLSAERRTLVRERAVVEQRELSGEASEASRVELRPEEQQGRTTGSLEWRRARGELGEASEPVAASSTSAPAVATSSTNAPVAAVATSSTSAASCSPAGASSADALPSEPSQDKSRCSTIEPASTTAPTASSSTTATTAAAPAVDAKEKIRVWLKSYLTQLQHGCGNTACTNTLCKSCAQFALPPDIAAAVSAAATLATAGATPADAGAAAATTTAVKPLAQYALQLIRQHGETKLCAALR